MKIAAAIRKPILIHCRTSTLATPEAKARFGPADAFADLMRLIGEHWTPTGLHGVMHCFSGSAEEAQQALAANFFFRLRGTSPIPSRSASSRRHARCRRIGSWSRPTARSWRRFPFRGKQNEPAWVTHTAAFVAELRGVSAEQVAQVTTANFQRLFLEQ